MGRHNGRGYECIHRPKKKRLKTKRERDKRRLAKEPVEDYSLAAAVDDHVDEVNLAVLQKDKVKATGGQGRTAPAKEVHQSSGTEREA